MRGTPRPILELLHPEPDVVPETGPEAVPAELPVLCAIPPDGAGHIGTTTWLGCGGSDEVALFGCDAPCLDGGSTETDAGGAGGVVL